MYVVTSQNFHDLVLWDLARIHVLSMVCLSTRVQSALSMELTETPKPISKNLNINEQLQFWCIGLFLIISKTAEQMHVDTYS
jgi:hypothetical protein